MPYKDPVKRLAFERSLYAKKPLITKTCTECLRTKTAKRWYLNDRCLACHGKACRRKNPAPYRATDKRRKKPSAQRSAEWRKNNPTRHKELQKKFYEENKEKFYAANDRRRAVSKRAQPVWLSKEDIAEMRAFYANRPEGYHVDHIVPLRGKDVCGLCVPWNLQYLPAIENLKKGNRCK